MLQVLTVPRKTGPAPQMPTPVETTPPKLLARSASPGPQNIVSEHGQAELSVAAAAPPDPGECLMYHETCRADRPDSPCDTSAVDGLSC